VSALAASGFEDVGPGYGPAGAPGLCLAGTRARAREKGRRKPRTWWSPASWR